jgi:hypothetical protein
MRVVRTIYASSRQIRADSLSAVKTALQLLLFVRSVIATAARWRLAQEVLMTEVANAHRKATQPADAARRHSDTPTGAKGRIGQRETAFGRGPKQRTEHVRRCVKRRCACDRHYFGKAVKSSGEELPRCFTDPGLATPRYQIPHYLCLLCASPH